MDRKLGGVLVLLMVVLAAALAPHPGRSFVVGAPLPTAVPPRPAPGDCLLSDPTRTDDASTEDGLALHHVTIGGCGGEVYGEIVSVTADAALFPLASDSEGARYDPGGCGNAVENYLGLPIPVTEPLGSPGVEPFVPWTLTATGAVDLLGPSPLQLGAGQNWVACAVIGTFGPYRGSVRGAFDGGHLPDSFAPCQAATGGDQPWISCGTAHRVEVFAATDLRFPILTQRALDISCARMVAALTGLRDPSAGGALRVAAVATHTDSHGLVLPGVPAASGQQSGQAFCTVSVIAPRRTLSHTLFGLGTAALPWAR